MTDLSDRRPMKARSSAWARALAAALANAGFTPDQISFTGLTFSVLGAAAFALSGLTFGISRVGLLLLAVLSIQLRLLCNLLDGMVAIEHRRARPAGPVWNDMPERIADALLLVGAGYAATDAAPAFGPALGWLCAVLAVLTAYVRELGRSLGRPSDFSGPMAAPHRMWMLSGAGLVSMLEGRWGWHGDTLVAALALTAALTLLTAARRTIHLSRELKRDG